MEHLSFERTSSYLNYRLKQEDMEEVEIHLAECTECATKVRSQRLFRYAWKTLTAKAHGKAYRQVRLESALEKASMRPELFQLRERIRVWMSSWWGKAEAILGIALEETTQRTQVMTQGFEALTRPESRLAFAFAQMPIRGREPDSIMVEAKGPPAVRVTIDSRKGTVTIALRDIEPEQKPPLVLLIPEAKDRSSQLLEPRQPRGSKQFVAQFSNVRSGKYLLAFEPTYRNKKSVKSLE